MARKARSNSCVPSAIRGDAVSFPKRPMLQVAESPAAYLRRPRLVVDASVLVAALFIESEHEQAMSLLRSRAIVAPHLLDLEVASAAQKKMGRENLPVSAVTTILEAYVMMPIERHAVSVEAVIDLAARYRLTVYDASYLWLAEKVEAPLATFDTKLAAAGRLHLTGDTTN